MEEEIFTASCHCKASSVMFGVSKLSLPLHGFLCHCNISRRISGVLCTSYVSIPLHNPKPNLDCLTPYKSSDILTRHFCKTCGTQMYLEYRHDGHFEVSTGTLDKSEGFVQFQGHMWIDDSVDGGASEWIRSIGGRKTQRWQIQPSRSPELAQGWRLETMMSADSGRLHVHCHCKGVEFWITRPKEESFEASSPFPDLLVPYGSGHSAENPMNNPWWVCGDKYLAGNCTCTSCRLISGFDIVQWAFVPICNIELPGSQSFSRDFGTLRGYRSSPKVTRYFCGECGASVFWDGDERPSVVDVAVGLLASETGARAEDWLHWVTNRVSFIEEGFNRELVEGLKVGIQEWKS